MTAGLVWRRGVIMMVRQDQGQVKVMGEEGMEMMVDISNQECRYAFRSIEQVEGRHDQVIPSSPC